METLSVKYICKLLALIFLLSIGFIYKVPRAGKKSAMARQQSELPEKARYTNASISQPSESNQLYDLVVQKEDAQAIINL